MKIDMNYEKKGTQRIKPESVNLNSKNKKAGAVNETIPQATHNISRKKALVDAAIINQIAQNFIQKAISISSKLKGIAIDAQVSGKIQESELSNALTGIKSSLNEIGDFANTAISSEDGMVIQQAETLQKIPGINDEIKSLNMLVNDLSTGNAGADLKKIDIISEDLTNKASIVNNSFIQIRNNLSEYTTFKLDYSPDEYSDIANKTSGQIGNSPQLALRSQGNLSNELVAKLL